VRKELKIKEGELRQALYQKQRIKLDTVVIVKDSLIVDSVGEHRGFTQIINYNPQTILTLVKKDSAYSVKLDISNDQFLYVYKQKQWKYPTFWSRLKHFSWKKVSRNRYKIVNSNVAIKQEDLKIVEIDE
jgi:hypothetical protein